MRESIVVAGIIGCSIAHELAKAEAFPSQQFLSKET